ncbi:Zinc finger CCCH domain-containing protein 33 [Forsythia ovata]|uniref:Zinc finger CCCH domain-containing protein 33 n=1 Tax=Forsythia ovata TaxID=205694 RepID=A0ABD1R1C1_9LAMI
MSPVSVIAVASSSSHHHQQNSILQLNIRPREEMESGRYPVRESEPDCPYYIRTGLCRFGATCRFNHPPNRNQVIDTARIKGEYPERIGQPECQYYLKTGTCKFGATCKFHHPRDKAGIAGRAALNVLGYPLRPNEVECAYYMRNGQCKFGSTCKFHHPQPSNMMYSLHGSSVYPPIHSPTTPGQLRFPSSKTSFIPSTQWQSPSGYAPLIMPQGVVSVPGWNAYKSHLGRISSSESQQLIAGNHDNHDVPCQSEVEIVGDQLHSGSIHMGYYAFQRENMFPERPGQPECQFYLKTGDCKFGSVCKFHHPRERLIPVPDCVLSPIGLPLRPGEPLCIFYSRYGICKFGPSCKFDHPMEVLSHSSAASLPTDSPAVHRLLVSSSGTSALNLSSEGLKEAGSTGNRRLSLSEARQMPSGDNKIEPQ